MMSAVEEFAKLGDRRKRDTITDLRFARRHLSALAWWIVHANART
jgi:hypothetical protein